MRRLSLARRLPLVMAGVATIAVLIGALVSWPLISNAADASARRTLSRTADLTAELLQRAASGGIPLRGPGGGVYARLDALLAPQQVDAFVVAAGAEVDPPLTDEDVVRVTSGGTVADKRRGPDGPAFVEGRPVGDGVGVLLVQPSVVARDLSLPAIGRLAVALLLGLGVAALVGWVSARRLTQPLAAAAAAAHAMGSGRRDVRVDPSGPEEVADIAIALNRLAEALVDSEGRQREFFLTVSHELRTPLTSIKGYAEALADGVVEPGDVAQVAGVVRSEADHLDRLVADLLDLARLGAVDVRIEPVDVDLSALGAEAASAWQGRAERSGLRFVDQVDRRPMLVRTDPNRVRQIIDNLMENALRVTGEGNPVVLSVGPGPVPGQFVVEVRDGGPGLTSDDLQVAVQPGELHARYRGIRKVGSGVGLALVARLAERLGGTAQAGTAREGGAAFRVLLPAVPPEVDARGVSSPPSRAMGRPGAGSTTPV